ncbi:MAG: hypothetical protein WCJ35_14520 [Planctomycetota bacterium]
MKANAWRKFFEEQRDRHGKVLFTVTELANVAGTSRAALNVELTRLRNQEMLAKYAHGLYGLPGAVSPQVLVPAMDSHAYITGHYALYGHQLVTQAPVTITCFTDRQNHRTRDRVTPAGHLVFVGVRSKVYFPVSEGAIAPPAQSLCDYVYLSRRQATSPEALVTFRNLARLRDADFPRILARYPVSVQEHVKRLCESKILLQ